ncbi:hypothetical protein V493_06671 [Pseudogymnoascus sp. VKM F-4281 (FW-2241)]|nr:hypothetical protein V493_06671 [Pseudogymnoascus sp. VKM F-4281 (FW-2241)]
MRCIIKLSILSNASPSSIVDILLTTPLGHVRASRHRMDELVSSMNAAWTDPFDGFASSSSPSPSPCLTDAFSLPSPPRTTDPWHRAWQEGMEYLWVGGEEWGANGEHMQVRRANDAELSRGSRFQRRRVL